MIHSKLVDRSVSRPGQVGTREVPACLLASLSSEDLFQLIPFKRGMTDFLLCGLNLKKEESFYSFLKKWKQITTFYQILSLFSPPLIESKK